MRSERMSLRRLGVFTNRALVGAVALTVALQILLVVVAVPARPTRLAGTRGGTLAAGDRDRARLPRRRRARQGTAAPGAPVLTAHTAAVDLYWIPLGAGGHSVRFNGLLFEAIDAARRHRRRCDLYHAALVIAYDGEDYTIEIAPSPDADQASRGVVGTGPSAAATSAGCACFATRCAAGVAARFRTPRSGRRAPPAQQRSAGRAPAAAPRPGRPQAGLGARRAAARARCGTRTP